MIQKKATKMLKEKENRNIKRNSKLLGLSSSEKQKLEGLGAKQISNKAPPDSGGGDQALLLLDLACGRRVLLQQEEQGLAIKKNFPHNFLFMKSHFLWP